MNDAYLFMYEDELCISICSSVEEMNNINLTNMTKQNPGFWKQCFKIKTTNFDLNKI